MATTINEKHSYPQSPCALFEVYVESSWIPQRYEGIGMRNIQIIKSEQSGNQYTVHTIREVRADIPRALAKLAGEWNTLEQVERWIDPGDGSYHCDFTVDIKGVPVELNGHMAIQAEGDRCANSIELTITCGIPLLGKTVEKFVGGDSLKSMSQEYAWIKNFLNSRA